MSVRRARRTPEQANSDRIAKADTLIDKEGHNVGWPHIGYKGNCLCVCRRCFGAAGCICRECAGKDHVNCRRAHSTDVQEVAD